MNDNNTFFENNDNNEKPEVKQEDVPQPIKVGEKEYTQDELSQLVGLGEIARDVETKYNTKIDRVYPEFTKATQEKKALQEEVERLKSGVREDGNIDPVAAESAKKVLKQLGYLSQEDIKSMGYVSREEARQEVINTLEARELISNTQKIVDDFSSKGLPKTSVEDLLKHMQESGIKNPEKAYKDKFEQQYDAWREKEYSKAKKQGMYTEGAGVSSKTPVNPKPKNVDELYAQVSEILSQGKDS